MLDPIGRIGAKAGVHARIEAFDRAQKAEVAFLDEVLQAETFAGVAARNIDDEAQIGADHAVAGLAIPVLDAQSERLLFFGI